MKSFMRSAAVVLAVACMAMFCAKVLAQDEGGAEKPKKGKKGGMMAKVEMTGAIKVTKGEDGKVSEITITEEGKEAAQISTDEKTVAKVQACDGKTCKISGIKGKDGKLRVIKCEEAGK